MATIKIPDDVLQAARMTEQDVLRELALVLFQQGRLSFGKARELAGMDFWSFQQLLGSRQIALHYDVAEFEEDINNASRLYAQAEQRFMARLGTATDLGTGGISTVSRDDLHGR